MTLKKKIKNIGVGLCVAGATALTAGAIDAKAQEPISFTNKSLKPIEHRLTYDELSDPVYGSRVIPIHEYKKPLSDIFNKNKQKKIKPRKSGLADIVKGVGGAIVGLGIHEGSHLLAGKLCDEEVDYDFSNPTQITYKTNHGNPFIHGAGLMGQTLATEIILGNKKIPKDNPFVLGILAFTIADNLRYAIAPDLRGKDTGDINNLKETGVNTDIVRGG